MSALNYEILDCDFDWRIINYNTMTVPFYDSSYENRVLVIQCDFAPSSDPTMYPEFIPATGFKFPPGVTLLFEGGSFSGVELEGNNTKIIGPFDKFFDPSVDLSGTFVAETFYPEWFGAVGDGITNDYKALNTACQLSDHVTLTQNYSIGTDSQILVNRGGSFTLIGYNSNITNNDAAPSSIHLRQPIFEFRLLDNLTIKGITVEGNYRMANALYINDIDAVTLEDITISGLSQNETDPDETDPNSPNYRADRTVAIRVDINNPSVVYGNNVRIHDIRGGQNTAIGDAYGIARALYIRLDNDIHGLDEDEIKAITQKTKVTFENSNFEWVYGDDGDLIDIIDENYISDALHRFIFTNCNLRYASRRLVKGSASGIQYYNCKFDTASKNELIAVMGTDEDLTPSGGVNFRNANPTVETGFRNMYGKMINCEYRNTGNLIILDEPEGSPTGRGEGGKLVAAFTDGLEIRGCTFYDMYLNFQDAIANAIIDNNTFHNSRIEFGLSLNEWEEGRCYVTNNQGFYTPLNTNQNALINSANDLIGITICDNKVFSNEDGSANAAFFGLIRHVTAGKASKVDVFRNEVYRVNADRNMLFISLRTWDATCRVFDNTNNAIGSAASYSFPNAIIGLGDNFQMQGPSWNNRDGNGDEI